MDVKTAAIQVLQHAGTALHAKDIAEQIMAAGLWQSEGKTPDATVSARLYSDIKSNGDKSPFVKVGPQTFALRDSSAASQISNEIAPSAGAEASESASAKGSLSFLDCAQKVLEEFSGKKPMHYKEITDKALKKGWLVTGGKTPEATMNAQILTEIKRQKKRGKLPRFVQHGKGYFGLSQWMGHGLVFQIEQHNQQVRKALRKKLMAITAAEFEELISQLLAEIGRDGRGDQAQRRWRHRCPGHPGCGPRRPHQDGGSSKKNGQSTMFKPLTCNRCEVPWESMSKA